MIAIAEPYPNCRFWKPFWYIEIVTVVVADPGPPLVMMYGWSNSCIALIKATTAANRMVGLISGTLIRNRVRIGPAPSICAASRTSVGTDINEATKSTKVNPTCCHTAISTMVAAAPKPLVSHGTFGIPSSPR